MSLPAPIKTASDPELQAEKGYFATEHLLEDLSRRSLHGSAINLAVQAVKLVLQMVSTIIMARLLTPRDFGLVAMVTAVTGLVTVFKDAGLSEATVQRSRITQEQVSTLFWLNCALSAAAAITVALLAPAIAWFYGEPRLTWVTIALSSTFFLSGLGVQHQALLRRQMQFGKLAIIGALPVVLALMIGICMGLLGFKYWSLVGASIGFTLCDVLITWALCSWRPTKMARNVGARALVAFGGNITGFNVLNYLIRNFDNILIGRVLGSVAIGIYSKAYGLLALPMSQINFPIGRVIIPALSRLQNQPAEYRNLYLRALAAVSFLTVPLVVFSFFLARDVVLVILGPKWLQVARVFQFLGPAALISSINVAPGWLCISLGTARKQFNYALISAPICITAFIIGVHWGVEGVAAAFSTVFCILFAFFIWYASKGSPVAWTEIAMTFMSVLIPSCLAGGIVWVLRHGPLFNASALAALITCAVAFAVIYLVSALAFEQNRRNITKIYVRVIRPYLFRQGSATP